MDKLLRIVDVNVNRSLEGLRVCEDITRFMLNDKRLTSSFRALRHRVSLLSERIDTKKLNLVKSRNVRKDIGKKTRLNERARKNVLDVFYANSQRVKESLRVLEEITKLIDRRAAEGFKKMRFGIYDLEKKSRIALETLLHR